MWETNPLYPKKIRDKNTQTPPQYSRCWLVTGGRPLGSWTGSRSGSQVGKQSVSSTVWAPRSSSSLFSPVSLSLSLSFARCLAFALPSVSLAPCIPTPVPASPPPPPPPHPSIPIWLPQGGRWRGSACPRGRERRRGGGRLGTLVNERRHE